MIEIVKRNIPKQYRNGQSTTNTSSSGGGSSVVVNGGGSNVAVIDNLTSYSSTSALSANQGRILNEIKPSKDENAVINGKYTFANGIKVDKEITTTDYAKGQNIGTTLAKNSNGKWLIETDNLKVRNRLDVETLQIEEAKYVGGKIYCTCAGIKINKIGEDENIYRCYFKNTDDDGTVIHNQFQRDDLVFCQTFNNNKLRRYWRYCTGAQQDYVDLSKSDFEEGSDIPMVGDTIVQLGNIRDTERQGAVIIETLAINIYNNINSYSLPAPIISLNPYNSKIDSDTINFIGHTIINGNFIVDNNGNLTVKGTINADKGYFRGFVRKGETVITKDNIKDFLYKDDIYGDGSLYQYMWKFDELSNIIYFEGDFPDSLWDEDIAPTVYYPSIYPYNDVNYSEEYLKHARSFIGTEMLLYNNSNDTLGQSGAMTSDDNPTELSFVSAPLNPNTCMKLKCMHTWINGNECVYWKYENGTFKKGN